MKKWFEDKELQCISAKCDEAHDRKEKDKLLELSDLCSERGHDKNRSAIERAKYLYDSFTCLSSCIALDHSSVDRENFASIINRYESEHEKCLYLCRTALKLAKDSQELCSADRIEEAYYNSLYFSIIVNYANLLSQTGRLISALHVLESACEKGFPMALGNLGLKLIEYANLEYDDERRAYLFRKAHKYISDAVENATGVVEKEAFDAFSRGKILIERQLTTEFLHDESEFRIKIPSGMSSDEISYREWCAKNALSLISLNDISQSAVIAYDPVHLPSIVCKIDDGIIPKYHGLFNQIKQEYVSARYLAYEGLVFRTAHFSDYEVYLVNTLDYPIYGLGIEKVKAAYRSVYALFDRIAYFLNEYFSLGIEENNVSYKSIWRKNSVLLTNVETNYPLLGLKWICKDVSNKALSDYKRHIDPLMAQATDIRNAMEHRYFKIIDDIFDNSDGERVDEFAYLIPFDKFEKITIELLCYAREAIMLLIMTVFVEEANRRKNRGADEFIGQYTLDKYEDDWKQIF